MKDLKITTTEKNNQIQDLDYYRPEQTSSPTLLGFVRKAAVHNKIRDLDNKAKARQYATKIILEAMLAHNIKNELNEVQKQDVEKIVFGTFNGLSLTEIGYALRADRLGEFGPATETYGRIDGQYLVKVLTRYKELKQKIKIEHNIIAAVSAPVEQFTQEQKNQMVSRGIAEEFNWYKDTGNFTDNSRLWIFDHLTEKGIIKMTKEEKIAFYKKVKSEMIENAPKFAAHRPVAKFKLMIEEDGNKSPLVANECKRRLIARSFDDVISSKKPINILY